MKPIFLHPIKLLTATLLWVSLSILSGQAQMRVGQPAGSPDPSAALDVSGGPYATGSQYRGIVPPKVALTQTSLAAPIAKPAPGLLVYNTAQTGDVKPGYYYWEGTRWERLLTGSSGAARLAANPGDLVPEYTIAQVRAFTTSSTTSPVVVLIIDANKQGLFQVDPSDNMTNDNTGRVLVTASGVRYKRIIIGGQLQLEWYGAKGDNTTDDTQAVQEAVNDALRAANPNINFTATGSRELPKFGNAGTLLVPVGSFKIGPITINGSIRIIGQGGGTYAGSTFVQKKTKESMFILGPDVDNLSNSTVIENICFKSGSDSVLTTSAQIKATATNSNSVYIRNCWFKSPEMWAIWLQQGDDCQISGCTFDVSPYHAIRLGTQGLAGRVSNCTVTNNTFYRISLSHIKVENVRGLVVSNNRIYNDTTGAYTSPNCIVVNGLSATNMKGITIVGNEYNYVPNFAVIPTNAQNVVISANTGYNTDGNFVNIAGSGILYGASITGNSVFSTTALSGTAVTGVGSGLQSSVILGNNFFAASPKSWAAINLPDSRVFNNVIDKNTYTNYSQNYVLSSPANNGMSLNLGSNLSDVPNKATARTNLGLGTAAQKDSSAYLAAAGGKLVSKFTATFPSTTGWSSTAYITVIPTGTLADATVYLVKSVYNKVGQDRVVQTWLVPVSATSNTEVGNPDELVGNKSIYRVSSDRFIRLRQTQQGSGGTFGLAAMVSKADMVASDASVTITITPLF